MDIGGAGMTGFSTEAVKNLSIAITIALILVMANNTISSWWP